MTQVPEDRLSQLIASARKQPRSQWREHLESLAKDAPELIERALAALEAELGGSETDSIADKLRQRRETPIPSEARYDKLEEVGRGGMGEVIRVRDKDLGRNLAMKLVSEAPRGETVDHDLLQRFLDEAQITGQLDHPGVVPVHDLGIDATGRAWFTMRLVKGDTADAIFERARARSGGWTITRAIEVLLKVCDTMAFAHRKGVLHRDLKPSNVMVGSFGEVYVMDWGLAKVVGKPDKRDLRIRPESTISKVRTERSKQEADSDSPLLTMDGDLVGTPCYMAPEQAAGRIEQMDQRSDVYAVGAMLYELLTGERPYAARGAKVNQHVVLASVLMGPPRTVTSIDKNAPAELVAICKKAMARDMSDRYPHMTAMATDLRAFVERRVVAAYRTGPVAELVSWVRRNRGMASLCFLALALMAWGSSVTVLATWNDRELRTNRAWLTFGAADRLLEGAHSQVAGARWPFREFAEGILLLADAARTDPANALVRERFCWEMAKWGELRAHTPLARVTSANQIHWADLLPGGNTIVMATVKGIELRDARTGNLQRHIVHEGRGAVSRGCVSPDGSHVAFADSAGTWLLNLSSGGIRGPVEDSGNLADGTAFSSDGSRLACWNSHWAQVLRVDDGTRLMSITPDQGISAFSLSSDGRHVATADSDSLTLWDVGTTRALRAWTGLGRIESIALSPSSLVVASLSSLGEVSLWSIDSSAPTERYKTSIVHRSGFLRWSPDGTRLLTCADGSLTLLNLSPIHMEWDRFSGDLVLDAKFTADGLEIYCRLQGSTTAMRVMDGCLVGVWPQGSSVYGDHLTTAGGMVLTGQGSRALCTWCRALPVLSTYLGSTSQLHPSGLTAVAATGNVISMVDLKTGRTNSLSQTNFPIRLLGFTDHGSHVVAIGERTVSRFRVDNSEDALSLSLPEGHDFDWIGTLASGHHIVLSGRKGVAVWDVQANSLRNLQNQASKHGFRMTRVHEGLGLIATVSGSNTATLYRLPNLAGVDLVSVAGQAFACDFNRDGTQIAIAATDHLTVVDTSSGAARTVEKFGCWGVTFANDDRSLVIASDEEGTRIVDAQSLEDRLWLPSALSDYASCTPSGRRLLYLDSSTDRLHVFDANGWRRALSLTAIRREDALDLAGSEVRFWDPVYGDRSLNLDQFCEGPEIDMNADYTLVAELASGLRLLADGSVQPMDDEAMAQVFDAIPRIESSSSRLGTLLRFLRHPSSDLATQDLRRARAIALAQHGDVSAILESMRLDPLNVLPRIAIAGLSDQTLFDSGWCSSESTSEVVSIRRTFLRDYALSHLPDDAEVCATAAKMLLEQQDRPRAIRAAAAALRLDPQQSTALRVQFEAQK